MVIATGPGVASATRFHLRITRAPGYGKIDR
jgi:hypothetical protein